jgi:hypothetical protein
MTFAELRSAVIASVEDIGRSFGSPDDDWMPVLLSFGGTGSRVIVLGDDKEQWHNEAAALRESEPAFVAAILSSWKVETENYDEDGPRPSEHPDRQEVLFIEMSDGQHFEMWEAPIIRFDITPPTLGEWQKRDITEIAGRIGSLVMAPFAGVKE